MKLCVNCEKMEPIVMRNIFSWCRMFVFIAILFVELSLLAVPTVTDVVAKQRFPWNGLVDITCEVSGIEGTTNGLYLAISAVMPESGNLRNVSSCWLVEDGVKSNDLEVRKNGSYHLVWDAKTDLGEVRYPNMSVCVLLNTNQERDNREMVQLWEGGPFWATMNIGAEKPEDYGYYFWWGDTIGYKRENDKWVASDGSNFHF